MFESVWKAYGRQKVLFLFLLPALVYVIVFNYVPMYGVIIAFKNFNFSKGIMGSEWVGFDNFGRLFQRGFLRVLRNTIVISLLKLIFVFGGSIVFALLLNEIRTRWLKRVVQNISYLPHFLSWVIIGSILVEMLSPSRGIVNQLIEHFGGTPIYFLADKTWFMVILILSDIWQSIGWGSIVYLAAITAIDPQLYESARMDGANRMMQVFNITLPSIMNIIIIMLLLQIGNILNAGFDQIFNLYNLKVFEVADILDTYAYRIGLEQGDYSLSTTISLFKNVVGLALVLAFNKIANRFGHTGLW
ncbi:putative multiple-sugar transport system permease YteP [Paenibacillus konkukensis]|uniref:Multiple-sugar transport system permease YteP n=1 Tax=Paenibacillus konkukensis TaxID=2020716 RepID=A0ABY4RX70_9BACL|nr:ABC transporter permease subunit [Paenibacillus konkukensis]UQZ86375.1 putative multiple-sugar transport system permease YteP [Paenibacillus konkukensis]